VHPNAERPALLRLKMYEFAGRVVGKCLYESALGGAYKQLVRARFTRSFLSQIIGLRMNYKVWTAVHSHRKDVFLGRWKGFIVYALLSARQLLDIPHEADRPDLFLGMIDFMEKKPTCFAISPTYGFKAED